MLMMPRTVSLEKSAESPNRVKDHARLREKLRKAGLRVTSARIHVLQLLEEAPSPLSHGDVILALECKAFDRATLYRNLMDMVEARLATRQHFGDNVWRFSLIPHAHFHHHHQADGACCEAENPHRYHPHFICDACHSVNCFDEASDITALLGRKAAHHLPHIREVVLRGLCEQCR